jgi:hypothetical protein
MNPGISHPGESRAKRSPTHDGSAHFLVAAGLVADARRYVEV